MDINSKALGSDIKKTLLSKTSLGKSFTVDKTLQQTAKNYLLLDKISKDLSIINQNIIKFVKAFGIQPREKEDVHFLKQDQREINFKVRQEKYIDSKVKKEDEEDGIDPKDGLLRKVLNKPIRKIKAKLLKKLRHNKRFRDLYRAFNKFKKIVKGFLSKFDFRKIIKEWFRTKGKDFAEFLIKNSKIAVDKIASLFTKLAPKLSSKVSEKLAQRGAAIAAASVATAWGFGFGGLIVTIGFILYDAVTGAIEEMTRTDREGNWFVGALAGVFSGITFGLIETRDIADQLYIFTDWLSGIWSKLRDIVWQSFDFVGKKITDFIEPYLKSLAKTFDMKDKQDEYDKWIEEEQIRFKKEKKEAEEALKKETEYITNLANENRKKTELKRNLINQIKRLDSQEERIKKYIEYTKKAYEIKQKAFSFSPEDVQDFLKGDIDKKPEDKKPSPKPEPVPVPSKPKEGSPEWFAVNNTNIDSWVNAVYQKKETIKNVPKVYLPYVNQRLAKLRSKDKKPSAPSPAPAPGKADKKKKIPGAPTGEPLVKKISPEAGKKALLDEMNKQKVSDPTTRAAIMAQAAKETGGFNLLSEDLRYSVSGLSKTFQRLKNTSKEDLAAAVKGGAGAIGALIYGGSPDSPSYAFGVRELGNTEPGDGAKYRGRGFFQLTGRANYKRAGALEGPEKLLNLNEAAKTAVDFALRYKGNFGDVKKFTKYVNGAYLGLKERGEYFNAYINDPAITKEGNLKYLEGVGGQDTDILSNAFTVVEAETGKKMIYDSKEIFLGHRNQKKPTEYDITNIVETENAKFEKFRNIEEKQKISTNFLLSIVT